MSEMNKALRRDPLATSPRSDLVAGTATNPPAVRPRSGARPAPPPEQGLSARFVLTALRRWWMVAAPIGLVLAAIGGTAVYLLFEPVYEASAWFKIEEQTPYLAFASNDQGQWQSFFQTESETIHAPFVLDPVVQRPEIARVPEIARQADKVAWLGKQIKTQRMGQSQYFKILFSNPDPKAAADVVNAVTEAYFKLRDQSDTDRNQKVITLLAQEMDKWLKDVLRLRDNLRTMTKDAAGKDPFLGKMAVNRQQMHPLADLDTQLVKVEVDSAVLEAQKKPSKTRSIRRRR